jgi:hypothetical protein
MLSSAAPMDRITPAQDDVLSASRTLIALYRPGFHVSIYRIRPGAELDFVEFAKIRRLNFDNINLDRPDIGYQVISGAPAGTYVSLVR